VLAQKLGVQSRCPVEFDADTDKDKGVCGYFNFHIHGKIQDLLINNIEIGNIVSYYPSPYVSESEKDKPSFYAMIELKSIHAEGRWAGSSNIQLNPFVGIKCTDPTDIGACHGTARIDVNKVVFGITMVFEKNTTIDPEHPDRPGLIVKVDGRDCNKNFDVSIDSFKINFEDADKLLGFIDGIWKLDDLVDTLGPRIIDMIKPKLPELLCPKVEELIDNNLTDLFGMANELIYSFWEDNKPLDIPVVEEMVDLHTSPIIDTGRFLFEKFIGVEGKFNLSYIVDIFSKGTGILRLKELYNSTLEFPIPIDALNATLTLGIDDVILEGLKTWREFSLLNPIEGSNVKLYSHTDLEFLAITLSWYIVVDVEGDMLSFGGETLAENATFYVKLLNNILDFYLQLASYNNLAQNYSNKMCMNTSCMEALISGDSTGMYNFSINMTFENISLTADKGDLEEDFRNLINNVVKMFVENYKHAIPPFVNGLVMRYVPLLNDLIGDLLADAYCEDDPDEEIIEVDVPVTVGSVGGASVLTALLMLLPCSGLIMKKKSVPDEDEEAAKEGCEMSDLATSYVEGADVAAGAGAAAAAAPKKKSKDDKYMFKQITCGGSKMREFLRIDEKASLFLDPRLSLPTRVIIPLLLFCTIAIFLSANTGVGASVFVVMTLGAARDVTLPSLFDFGLINTIVDMWTAEVYPLSILVAFFSGIWPYLKVVLMILCWFLPTKIFSVKSRGLMLEWLDILGKWSLLDTYVMIMMLVAFHFNIEFPIVNTEDITKPTAVQIFVYPAYGFLALILGTLFSLIMSHVLLALHRHVLPPDHMNDCDDAQRMRPMFAYAAAGQNPITRLVTRIGLTVGLAVSLIMMFLGTILDTFSFDFVGLVGWLLPMLDIDPHRAYSVLSLTTEVPPSAQEPNSFTVRFTQVVFIMTAFIFPVLHILAMFVLWLVPFKRKVQHYLHYACEVLSAWSCVDVFIISIIAACLEIQQFAGFMVGDKCDFLTPYMEEYFVDYVGENLSCFEVIATLESGCYVLFIGTIIYTAVYMTFNRVIQAALRTRGNDGIPMTKEQVKELEDRGKNKKKEKKPKQAEFGSEQPNNTFAGGINTSQQSFVQSVSTLSIAQSPNDGSYGEEVDEDEASDSSVEDLEAPGEAPLPPPVEETAVDTTV